MKNSLSKRKLERYSRQIILKDIGILGQKKIINSKVLIVGIGGLGSPVADLLARCGVGYIGAIDHDKVDISNLQRQILYTSCLLYTSPSPRDLSTSRMPSSA